MIPQNSKELTSDWLNKTLHKSGFLKDADIKSIKYESIGADEGFASEIGRITLVFDRDASHLPKSIIVKMPSTYAPALAIATLYKIYEKEVKFYLEVAPESPIRTPKLIHADYDLESKRYILIMEDCACYTYLDRNEGLNYEQTKLVIKTIADFHSYWWNHDRLFSFDWMAKPRGWESISMIDFFRNSWDASMKSDEWKSLLPEGAEEVGYKVYKHFPWLVDSIRDEFLTICHFDYHAKNMFFDFKNKENPVIVYDWGGTFVAGGLMDIAYFLSGNISVELRRKIEKEMIQFYLDRLSEKGVDLSKYIWDMCWEDYLKATMSYAWLSAIAFTNLDWSSEEAKEMLKIASKRYWLTIIDNDGTSFLPS